MPDGRTHIYANTALSAVVYFTAQYFAPELNIAPNHSVYTALLGGLILGSFFISPDLDLYGVRTVTLKAWGPLWILWWPVLRFSRHRGRSHTYIRGPLFRLAYFAFIVGSIAALTGHFPNRATLELHFLPFFIGYMLPQWLHLIMDGIPPYRSRL